MAIAPSIHSRKRREQNQSWITPKWLLDRLGPFDLDPCASDPQPWPTAERMITERENGLLALWMGFVWLNPPYKELPVWLERGALHNDGIALVFARTETRAFHRSVWPFASSLLFLEGRLQFHYPNGEPAAGSNNSGGPSVLIGYGAEADRRLQACADLGAYLPMLTLRGYKPQ